jgi:hypothetical protein
MNEQPRTEPARRARGKRSVDCGPIEPGRPNAARVTVAWTPLSNDGMPGEIELVDGLEAAQTTTWTCRRRFASNWVEAIASARCSEVVLTARLGDDLPAKHRVLDLAELLTFYLAATQPLIRVRFLPTTSKRRGTRSPA